MAYLARLHTLIHAWFLKFFRTREVMRVYTTAHAEELRNAHPSEWPLIKAKQSVEIASIKAGKLQITDRKSWQFPFLPASVQRFSVPIMKSIPYALRRMSRTPVPRRAINLIKGSVISQNWDVRPIDSVIPQDANEQEHRRDIARKMFKHPNNVDSFQTMMEMCIEDLCVVGACCLEMQFTVDPERPLKAWTVLPDSIRIFASWSEATPDAPHYAQMTGLKGERGAIIFYDDEMLYCRDNQSSDSPFGIGKMEIAFSVINSLLGLQDMAGRAGSDQIHKTWLWWEQPQPDCFDDQTEVLVRRGWIKWEDTCEDDEFATRTYDGKLEWQRPTKLVKSRYAGPMINFTNRNLNICVTPKHRMFGRYAYDSIRKNGRYDVTYDSPVFSSAKDVCSIVGNRPGKGRKKAKTPFDFRIPCTSTWAGQLYADKFVVGKWSFDWADWAAFLGIWAAEGHTSGSMAELSKVKAAAGGHLTDICGVATALLTSGVAQASQNAYAERTHNYKIGIAQSKEANPDIHAQIEALLTRMGLPFYTDAGGFLFTDHDLWQHLTAFGNKYTKHVPSYIKDAPSDIIDIFIDWAVKGDGWGTTSRCYFTTSRQLADDMQELFQKVGAFATIRSSPAGVCSLPDGRRGRRAKGYTIEEHTSDEISVMPGVARRRKNGIPTIVDYNGFVYCASVPNGTLYTRRNGYPFWSGNSSYQIVRRHIQNELEGQAKVSIIGGMKKPEIVEIQPVAEEDLLLNWQEMLIRMIANGFDLSAMSLGIEHDVNRAVGSVLSDRDFRSAVVPMARRLEEIFTRKILHDKLGWHDLEFKFLNLDDPDAETKMELFAKMYSANAITPDEIAIGMGRQPVGQFGALTQFEAMMIMAQFNSNLAMDQQKQGADLQQQMMEKQQAMMGPQGPPDPNDPNSGPSTPATEPPKQIPGQDPSQDPNDPANKDKTQQQSPGSGAKGGGPASKGKGASSPLPNMTLPKFPMAAGRYTAKELAFMPVNQLSDFVATGQAGTPKQLLKNMQNQEPSIIEQLSDDVRQYFEDAMKREEKEKRAKLKLDPKALAELKKQQQKRVSGQRKRTNDYTEWMGKYRNGKPGGPTMNVDKNPGKPGDLNHWIR